MNNTILSPMLAEQRAALEQAAKADGRFVPFPTHIVTKQGAIVGGVSLGVLPTVIVWLDRKQTSFRDAYHVFDQGQALLREQGIANIVVPCFPGCQLGPLGDRLAQNYGNVNLYMKNTYGLV